jgi:hypothetical protein
MRCRNFREPGTNKKATQDVLLFLRPGALENQRRYGFFGGKGLGEISERLPI